jgi:hypothetical protein
MISYLGKKNKFSVSIIRNNPQKRLRGEVDRTNTYKNNLIN